MKVVLATDLLLAGASSAHGAAAAVLRAVLAGRAAICVDERVLSEYRAVLLHGPLECDAATVDELLAFLDAAGTPVLAPPLAVGCPDPDDAVFVEVAAAAGADFLVTGNAGRFPDADRHGVVVVEPGTFLDAVA